MRAVGAQAGRHDDLDVAEAEIAELEGAPVEVGIEGFGDLDDLGGGRGAGLVLKLDRVGIRLVGGHETG